MSAEYLAQPRLLIVGMGGVMVQGTDVVPRIAEHLAFAPDTVYEFSLMAGIAELGKGLVTQREFWHRFRQCSGCEAQADLWEACFAPVRRPEMYTLIDILRQHHRVVAGTNTVAVHYDIHWQRGDYDVFDTVYASHQMHTTKPEQVFFRAILAKEQVSAAKTILIDDKRANVIAACELGIHAVHFRSVHQTVHALRHYINDVTEQLEEDQMSKAALNI